VYTIVERGERGVAKSYWSKVGIGFVNRDGSITLKLDALPVNGTLQIRDWEEREDWDKRRSQQTAQNGGTEAEHAAFPDTLS
jgi:hypothetical protein